MYNLSQHLHFIGIGGVGMAGIAEVLLNLGYQVSGSDIKDNSLTAELREVGGIVHIGHQKENLPDETSVVVVSSAISSDNPELLEAESRGLPVIPRAEMLAELMRMKYGIAVAGSHGKTTTTSMCAKLLRDVGHDPTVIVGGRVLTQATGANLGTGQYLVAEADESDGSFCLLRPAIAVITNIDSEHMPFYGSFEALEEAFRSFAASIPFYGLVVACADDAPTRKAVESLSRRVLTYGLTDSCDIYAADVTIDGPSSRYTLMINGEAAAEINLPMPGRHMVLNSLAAAAVALELGAYPEEIAASLAEFPGVSRRTERIGEVEGVLVLDDYAHHPTEIAATLSAVRRGYLPGQAESTKRGSLGRLHVVFEPHRYTRTRDLLEHFKDCFVDADSLYIGEVYAAGEAPIEGINGKVLAEAVSAPSAVFCENLAEVVPQLCDALEPGDVVITLGAGAVGKTAAELVHALSETAR